MTASDRPTWRWVLGMYAVTFVIGSLFALLRGETDSARVVGYGLVGSLIYGTVLIAVTIGMVRAIRKMDGKDS